RHAEQAVRSAQNARLTGTVSIGLPATTESILGLPLIAAMRARHPQVRLHMVGGMSGNLGSMLNARELDIAILFDQRLAGRQSSFSGRNWVVRPLFEEQLFFIRARQSGAATALARTTSLQAIAAEPLILPTMRHGLRTVLNSSF